MGEELELCWRSVLCIFLSVAYSPHLLNVQTQCFSNKWILKLILYGFTNITNNNNINNKKKKIQVHRMSKGEYYFMKLVSVKCTICVLFQLNVLYVYFLLQVTVKSLKSTTYYSLKGLWTLTFLYLGFGCGTPLSSHSSFWIVLRCYHFLIYLFFRCYHFLVAFSTGLGPCAPYMWLFFCLSHCTRAI